jgi:hypothetical protein
MVRVQRRAAYMVTVAEGDAGVNEKSLPLLLVDFGSGVIFLSNLAATMPDARDQTDEKKGIRGKKAGPSCPFEAGWPLVLILRKANKWL